MPGLRDVPERTHDVPVAVAVALVVLVLALVGARQSRLLALEQREADDRRALTHLAAGVAADLRTVLDSVTLTAAGGSTTAFPGADSVGFVPLEPARTIPTGPLSEEERVVPAVATFLERLRDSGSSQLSPPVELTDGLRTLAAAPVYGPGEASEPPRTPEARRARLQGWVVATVDLEALVEPHLTGGFTATVRQGDHVTTLGGDIPGRAPEVAVDVGSRRFALAAGRPDAVPLGASAIWLAIAGLLGAPAAAGLTLLGGQWVRRLRAEFVRRESQVRLIGEVAPLVQQSLELSDVLPSVAVQLSDHFDLTGIRLSAGEGGEQEELFKLGQRPDASVRPVLRPPDHLPAGETLTLGLQRGGRSVALLQVVGERDLGPADLESLRALSELVAAALVNASLYAHQQQAMRRLQELDQMKTVFLSTASHELRTPATAIAGFAGLLAEKWERFDDEERKEFARRIEANALSLSRVVEDLLDFSLLEGTAAPLAAEPVDLDRLVRAVADRLAPVLGRHEVRHTSVDAPLVAAEVHSLERVVTNLLTNAAKFSPEGSTIAVTVAPDPVGDGAALVVSDEGPGVPPHERQQVFTRFFRGAGDAVVQTRGVGIGLSVVAELVARMHGRVDLDDAPGGGARFTIRLPAASAAGSPTEELEDASPA